MISINAGDDGIFHPPLPLKSRKFLDFHYAIDDVEVDEKTYYEKLKKIYDEKAAIYSFCDGCNKEEFITALSEY